MNSKSQIIWRDTPATCFTEAYPLGNGRIGAMVYGGVQEELIELNEDTLWSGAPRIFTVPKARDVLPKLRKAILEDHDWLAAKALSKEQQGCFTEKYLPAGRLHVKMDMAGDAENYRHELSLNKAQTTTTFKLNGTKITRECFVSEPDQVMVIRLTSSRIPMALDISLDSVLVGKASAEDNTLQFSGRATTQTDDTNAMRFSILTVVRGCDGTVQSRDGHILVSDATTLQILLTIGTSFNGFAKHPFSQGRDEEKYACSILRKAIKQTSEDLLCRHQSDFLKLYSQCYLDLGVSGQESKPTEQRLVEFDGINDLPLAALLFNYGRYLLISCSRGGTQAANLQGIWNNNPNPPWLSNYTININTEMNYWPTGPASLLECDEPLIHLVEDLRKTGSVVASVNYGCRGWVAHHNTDLWRQTCPVGNYGAGDPIWANWEMGGIWLCMNLWEHYAFSGDVDYLRRKAWPAMKGAAQFALDWLVEEERDGKKWLVTAPSTSPENNFVTPEGIQSAVCSGATMDLALIRELFENCCAAAAILNLGNDATVNAIKRSLPKIMPFQIGKYGQLQEWSWDWDRPEDHNRHVSHLVSVYPGRLMTAEETPELMKAARKSLEMRGDEATGWSLAWKVCFYARFAEGDHAWKMICMLLRLVEEGRQRPAGQGSSGVYANLFDAHPPFQIDGNFGATAGMAEMLVQSHWRAVDESGIPHPVIQFLPALPSAWKNGRAVGLGIRGGIKLDISWENGKLKEAVLRDLPEGLVRIRTREPLIVCRAKSPVVSQQTEGILAFLAAPGRDYVVRLA